MVPASLEGGMSFPPVDLLELAFRSTFAGPRTSNLIATGDVSPCFQGGASPVRERYGA
jgi:hypothetical protein